MRDWWFDCLKACPANQAVSLIPGEQESGTGHTRNFTQVLTDDCANSESQKHTRQCANTQVYSTTHTHTLTLQKIFTVACVTPVMRDTKACSLWVSFVYFLQARCVNKSCWTVPASNECTLVCGWKGSLCDTRLCPTGEKITSTMQYFLNTHTCYVCVVGLCIHVCVCVCRGGGMCIHIWSTCVHIISQI